MSVRWTQVKKLDTVDVFREHCASLGIEIPIDDAVDAAGVLAEVDGMGEMDQVAKRIQEALG